MKQFILVVGLLGFFNLTQAQKSQVQAAWRALNDYEEALKDNSQNPNLNYLNKAKEAIDKALQHEDTKNQTKAHAYKMRISFALFSFHLNEETKKLETTVLDKTERYTIAYGTTSLVEFEEANAELAWVKETDPKYIELIQNGIATGSSSLDEEDLRFAITAQQMKEKAPNIASGKYRAKNYDVAADYFYKSAFMNTLLYKTKDTANFYNACIAASKSRNPEKIIDYNKKMIDAKVDMPYNYQSIADAYLLKNDTAQALGILKKGRELYPDNFELLSKETDLFILTHKQREALVNLNYSSQKDPKNALYYLMMGNIYDNMANPKDNASKDLPKPSNFDELFKSAETNYNTVIDLKPANKEYLYNALFNLGAMYNNYGAYLENLKIEKITDFAKYQKENAEKSQVLYKKAIPPLEKALEMKPDDKATMSALRLLYFKVGNENQAKEMSEKIKNTK